MSKPGRLLGAILFVSGTTVGAGMLALPVTTGLAGFFPSLLIMGAIWLFMMMTAFYFLEVNLKIKGESHFISMTHQTLGKPAEIIAWICYLLLLYALTSAYLLGCSQILDDLFGHQLPIWVWPIAVFVFFACFIYLGTHVADILNRFMMIGLIVAYCFIVSLGCCRISPTLLSHVNWTYLLPSISVTLTTFGYHVIIPTLSTYLDHDGPRLKKAIFFGSLIPFAIYIIWQLLVMGVIPAYGENSLSVAAREGLQVTFFLNSWLQSPFIGAAVLSFAFFAIVTSLLGVSLSLVDFLADALKIQKTQKGKFILVLLTFLPPLIFAYFYPKGFILALHYAGIMVLILLALLPALMAFSERYVRAKNGGFIEADFKAPGGRILLVVIIALSLILLGIEVFWIN